MVHQELGYVGYFDRESCDLDEFKVLTSQNLTADAVPHAVAVEKNVPVYDMDVLRTALTDADQRKSLLAEWARVLGKSAGVIVLKSAYADTSVIDRASDVFREIIEEEREGAGGEGDHFAASGANDRIWNALQKQCLRDPEGFALYFGNAAVAAACEAWLGPNYQMTAQVNQVRPGGKAQQAHRDYHLGFQNADSAARYPAHAHHLTAALTLQGAVAHCDMPVESGPTKLLPFSQLYAPGYLAFHDPAHRDHFEQAYIQLPLNKGDAVFFNPALFHAAGENSSNGIHRMANLLQVSSAFGRAMEAVDRAAMSQAVFPALAALKQRGDLSALEIEATIGATAEGYPFPTNLDTDPPVGGNAPDSQADILRRAVSEGWSESELADALSALLNRQAA
ncbi:MULTISPECIES: phytanoyl-CoA dioxygenase family protein [unclassified Ruegeria]|uniref:phytanoyl-CoA dioxygenase family protein n=1 Tax=unclassified Ruegeria TaxID=2625375 RepID=UPI00148807E6|nr:MULTISPECIES: phytanoyl-CoA dioxygenase family protein [unclassified Ruegeria]NOD64242.1 phytanoyl-CoA dioxygenase [Ruegeria sp. HKCCD6109]